MSSTRVQQPLIIEHGGHRFERVKRLTKISDSISEGPFYKRPGVNPKDWAFLPDYQYLLGRTTTPSFMHCIQQCESPTTPRPTQ